MYIFDICAVLVVVFAAWHAFLVQFLAYVSSFSILIAPSSTLCRECKTDILLASGRIGTLCTFVINGVSGFDRPINFICINQTIFIISCKLYVTIITSTIHWPNVGSMVGQIRRRWTNIEPTLGQPVSCFYSEKICWRRFVLALIWGINKVNQGILIWSTKFQFW